MSAARIQRRAPGSRAAALTSTGLLIVNPPWTLAGELKTILPELEKPLGQGGAGRFRLETPKAVSAAAAHRLKSAIEP